MSENTQIVFRLPNRSGWRGADGTADFVDAVGAVFETVHTLFDREPEQYAPLSAGAVYVPLSALETAYRQDKPVGGLEDMLFANLEYPFPQAAFDAYLSDGIPLTAYTESIAPGGSFWCAAAQSARQEEFDRLMEAVHRMLAVTDCDSEETVETLCRTCSLARMRRYCETADSKQTVCDRFAGCYDAAMAGSGESIAPEERAFLRSALVLYSLWELRRGRTRGRGGHPDADDPDGTGFFGDDAGCGQPRGDGGSVRLHGDRRGRILEDAVRRGGAGGRRRTGRRDGGLSRGAASSAVRGFGCAYPASGTAVCTGWMTKKKTFGLHEHADRTSF